MDAKTLRSLLHQSESETLDFKREQYPFKGAGHNAKSEMLKDILAMANAWKSTDAHILIGVAEKTGVRADVVGVSDHLDDANLQQFVNEKTNRPVLLSYLVVTIDDTQVGVIKVKSNQVRPVFLKREFGKLKKHVVYIRRGSSTAEANPDEVAEIGMENLATPEPPSIEVEFADIENRLRLGTNLVITSTLFVDPPPPSVEQVKPFRKQLGVSRMFDNPLSGLVFTKEFLDPFHDKRPTPEEARNLRQESALLTGVGFWVRNYGAVTANDVRIDIQGAQTDGLHQLDERSHPKNRTNVGFGRTIPSVFRPAVGIEEHGTNWTLSIEVGKLQPKSEAWIPDLWYLGSWQPIDLDLRGRIFTDNLSEPIVVPLRITIETRERVYRVADFGGTGDGR